MTQFADVRVDWRPSDQGGRSGPVQLTSTGRDGYKPHLRVAGAPDVLGVAFVGGDPAVATPGVRSRATIAFIYDIDYSPLTVGAQFEVLEGATVVGSGEVLRRFVGPTW
jgi:hypothetical protein